MPGMWFSLNFQTCFLTYDSSIVSLMGTDISLVWIRGLSYTFSKGALVVDDGKEISTLPHYFLYLPSLYRASSHMLYSWWLYCLLSIIVQLHLNHQYSLVFIFLRSHLTLTFLQNWTLLHETLYSDDSYCCVWTMCNRCSSPSHVKISDVRLILAGTKFEMLICCVFVFRNVTDWWWARRTGGNLSNCPK